MTYMRVPFIVEAVDVDERLSGAPGDVVCALARRKAEASCALHPDRVVLAADTLVEIGGQTLGKPADELDAARMIRLLSGAWHTVHSGVCVIADGRTLVRHEATRVLFCDLTDAQIARYVQTCEPMDKAGAYALQGIGGMFVRRIEGSYSNVIGLPMATVRDMLLDIGYEI